MRYRLREEMKRSNSMLEDTLDLECIRQTPNRDFCFIFEMDLFLLMIPGIDALHKSSSTFISDKLPIYFR
jgi:hypothetical protein